jgi:hypothetical protein
MKLNWIGTLEGPDAVLGNFYGMDGVRFSMMWMPTCNLRGPWRLLIEIRNANQTWAYFDDEDQPMRWYHSKERAMAEAQAIADVLAKDHDWRVSVQRESPRSSVKGP